MATNPKAAAARYLRLLFVVAFGLVLAVAALNLFVDPYNRFGLNRLGVFISAEREAKTEMVERYPHDALLLGNSRAAMIPAADLKGGRFFNAAFGGATLEEMKFFLEAHLRRQKLVVLALDPFTLGSNPSPAINPALAPLTPRLAASYLLNTKTLEYSFETISKRIAHRLPSLLEDGTVTMDDWRRQRDVDNPAWQAAEIAKTRRILSGFRHTPRRLELCREIQRLVASRGARLVVFLGPVDEDVESVLEDAAIQPEWEKTVGELRKVFPGVVDLTRSKFSRRELFFKTDPVHFRPEVGVEFINERVLGPHP